MEKAVKVILVSLILILQIVSLKPALGCRDFSSYFHFSSYDLKLQIEDAVHNDVGIPLWQARFFHNKLTFFILDIFR